MAWCPSLPYHPYLPYLLYSIERALCEKLRASHVGKRGEETTTKIESHIVELGVYLR